MKLKAVILAVAVLFLCTAGNIQASGDYKVEHKNAIVLAMFGTTVEPALQNLLNIREKVMKEYPDTLVRVSFTSNIIRNIWQHRAEDPEYIKAHPEIPEDILHVKTMLATIADLQNEGYDTIIIQPTHVSMGEEYLDLHTYANGLMSMGTVKKPKYKPFHKVVLSRPLLGTYGTDHPYVEDIVTTAKALAEDAKFAAKNKAGLVYMGHGNEFMPSGGANVEFANKMRAMYPDVVTVVGSVEGFPGLDEVIEELKLRGVKKVVLQPFMVVAGDHAMNDMASDEDDSWKTLLTKAGFEVVLVVKGLGINDKIADIYVSHIADTAKAAHIKLK